VNATPVTCESRVSAPDTRNRLLSALRGLDRLLEGALRLASEVYGWAPSIISLRRHYISSADAEHMLGEIGAEQFFEIAGVPPLAALAERCKLSWFDCAIILIALAHEIDLHYERLYAYLQDDVSRRRPTVDLILNLLCPTTADRLNLHRHFAPDSILVRHRRICVAAEPNRPNSALLARTVTDEQGFRGLFGRRSLNSRPGGRKLA
jgi:hypothetical protein